MQEKQKTVVNKEFSEEWDETKEGYYPVNDEKNNNLYKQYKELAEKEKMLFLEEDWLNIDIMIWKILLKMFSKFGDIKY